MAVVLAVEKWRPYLLGRHFIIKTDHFSLKFLMEQKRTTIIQSKLTMRYNISRGRKMWLQMDYLGYMGCSYWL